LDSINNAGSGQRISRLAGGQGVPQLLTDLERSQSGPKEVVLDIHFKTEAHQQITQKTSSQPFSITQSASLHELSRDQPAWPFTHNPLNASSQLLGNGVAVHNFPIQITFYLQTIICGKMSEKVLFSWELARLQTDSNTAQPLLSSSQEVSLIPLGMFPEIGEEKSLGFRVATIKERLSPFFQEEGVYVVTAKLNAIEENFLPVLVWQA
jgi:hypothetical protein